MVFEPLREAFMSLMHRLVVFTFGLSLSVGFGTVEVAHGYLLPSQQLIEFVARQTSKLYNFRLEVRAESPDPDNPEAVVEREIVFYAARPDFLRQETIGVEGATAILVGSGRRLSVIDGQLLTEEPRHEDIFPKILFARSAETLGSILAEEQVDLNQVHLRRLGRQIAYVIGGPPRDSDAPQFWCDKERFWPLRLVGRRSRQGISDLVDIRFLSYRQVASDIWMPSVIEFHREKQLLLRLVVQTTQINEPLSDALFDLEAFAAKHPPLILPKEPSERPAEGLEEMRRYLEKKYD
ncbi:MAG: hypothetical protein JSU72_07750 [Deltaproteobacteria bacterium]|nr:MAG: hypothetical protein JSU72_07750 [Deltaproteobacteria bacterium]